MGERASFCWSEIFCYTLGNWETLPALCSVWIWHSFQTGSVDAGSVLSWQLYLSSRGKGPGIPACWITALSYCHRAQSVHLQLSKPTAWTGCHLCIELGQNKSCVELFLQFQGCASAPEWWIMQRVISEEKSFSFQRGDCMWKTVWWISTVDLLYQQLPNIKHYELCVGLKRAGEICVGLKG